jgi:hypothetical protein
LSDAGPCLDLVLRDPAPVVADIPRRQGLTLMELTSRTCRWPLWGKERRPERYYCGEAAAVGAVYCKTHCKLAAAPRR